VLTDIEAVNMKLLICNIFIYDAFQVAMDIIKSEPDLESDLSASDNELDKSDKEDPLAMTLPTVKPEAEVRFSCFTEYRYFAIYATVMFQRKVMENEISYIKYNCLFFPCYPHNTLLLLPESGSTSKIFELK
jgi:hypothetical protein